MNEEKENLKHEEHTLGMVRGEDGSYYPGCVACSRPLKVARRASIRVVEKRQESEED